MPRQSNSRREADTLGTVARASVILRSLAEAEEEVSIKALSDQLSLAPSTIHRLLHLLMEQGLVERGESGHRYHAGREFFRLGALVVNKTRIPKLAMPYMRAVVDKIDEFCLLNMYLPAERSTMIVQTLSSSHPLTYTAEKYKPTFDMSGHPTLTLPGGVTADGVPVGFQIVGHAFDEAGILAAGHTYQQATDWHLRRPPV